MRCLAAALLLVGLWPTPAAAAEAGSVCVAPALARSPIGGLCGAASLFLKIDKRDAVAWPLGESMKIADLDPAGRHRVVLRCGRKPQQSFSFLFAEAKSTSLCLFVNDLYGTAQLWDRRRSPWCT